MLIKSIFMELRSRLRSCNVYITTAIDISKHYNLKISIQADCIILNYYSDSYSTLKRRDSLSSVDSLSDLSSSDYESDVTTIIPIQDFCQMIPNSMSGLKIDNNNISFRILTEANSGGSFYTELLSPDTVNSSIDGNDCKINIEIGANIKINCENCSNIISMNPVKFKRILELPTSNLDMSEWFCHHHGSNSDTSTIIQPSKEDFLYRLTFFVVNSSILSEKTNKFNDKREVYHCNRCLAWLGLKNKDAVKLFNSTVTIEQEGNVSSILRHQNPMLNDKNINDFIYTIERMTKEFNLGFQYTIMCKIVLECTISASQKQYLLIWVMDKKLQVLQDLEYAGDEILKLKSSFLTKILFKLEVSLNEEVESWIADPAVVSTEVSKAMFCNGVDHLNNMSLKVPDSFRSTSGYTVSYLNV